MVKSKLKVLEFQPKPTEPEVKPDTPVQLLQRIIEHLTTGELKDEKYTDIVVLLDGKEATSMYRYSNALARQRVSWMLQSANLAVLGAEFRSDDD